MRHTGRNLLLALATIFIYIIANPIPTGRELVVHHRWASVGTSAAPENQRSATPMHLIPFKLEQSFGYVDETGAVQYAALTLHDVAMSGARFSNYSQVPNPVVIQSASGELEATLPVTAYPFFVAGRLFTVDVDSTHLSEWDDHGTRMWTVALPGPLTALDAGEDLVVAGTVVGGVTVITRTGEVLEVETVGTDKDGITLGVAITPDETGIAAVIATDQPSVLLLERAGSKVIPVIRRRLAEQPGIFMVLEYSSSGNALYYQGSETLVVLDLEGAREYMIAAAYPATGIVDTAAASLHVVLTRGDFPDPARGFQIPSELMVVTDDGLAPITTVFAAGHVDLQQGPESVILAVGERLLAFSLGEG